MTSSAPIAPLPAGERPRSSLARTSLVAYAVLLIYGSLSPWTGWRALGVNPLAFLGAPWPAYVTGFDLALNVLAYVPLGLLLALALHPRPRRLPAILAATAAAACLSVLIESVQNYLPARIASNLDVLTNVAGAALGALAGTALAPALVDGGRLQQARQQWFRPHTAAVLLTAALWPPAQIHPGPMLFGNGELDRDLICHKQSSPYYCLNDSLIPMTGHHDQNIMVLAVRQNKTLTGFLRGNVVQWRCPR